MGWMYEAHPSGAIGGLFGGKVGVYFPLGSGTLQGRLLSRKNSHVSDDN